MLSACGVILNILARGKVTDSNQDIFKSSSLPTLLNQLLKLIVKAKAGDALADIATEVINCIAEMSKISYTKAGGIEPVYMKHFVPLLPTLLREPCSNEALLASLKALGTFVS